VTLLGLTGQPGAGKNTAADYLVEAHGFVQMAFADTIRQVALVIDPYVHFFRLSDVIGMIGWEKAKRYPEVRRLLQVIGTEAGRDVHGSDVWVDKTFAAIEELGPNQPVVLTDVRFDNEARRLRSLGGRLVRIQRQTDNQDTVLAHRSETESAALLADVEVTNHSTQAALYRRLDLLLQPPTTRSQRG